MKYILNQLIFSYILNALFIWDPYIYICTYVHLVHTIKIKLLLLFIIYYCFFLFLFLLRSPQSFLLSLRGPMGKKLGKR